MSTVGDGGFPSGRFVDLKAVDEHGFTFCTYLDSEKGRHIAINPKVASTVWSDHVGYKVRIKGLAEPLPEAEALEYWVARTRDAQLTTLACQQSQALGSEEKLVKKLTEITKQHEAHEIPRPRHWGGYRVKPVSFEFFTFKDTRLHRRELFAAQSNGAWRMTRLQP